MTRRNCLAASAIRAKHHRRRRLAGLPVFHVAGPIPADPVHRRDGVGRPRACGRESGDTEAHRRQRLDEPRAKRPRRAGVSLVELSGEVLQRRLGSKASRWCGSSLRPSSRGHWQLRFEVAEDCAVDTGRSPGGRTRRRAPDGAPWPCRARPRPGGSNLSPSRVSHEQVG